MSHPVDRNNMLLAQQSSHLITKVQEKGPSVEELFESPNKIYFDGSSLQFKNFVNAANLPLGSQREEAEFKISGINLELQNMGHEDGSCFLKCCCCSEECSESCTCCLCFFSCCLLVFLWWIICPISYCCVKKKINSMLKFSITADTYDKFRQLCSKSQLKIKKLSLKIKDNYFDSDKIQCIKTFIQQTNVTEFAFENEAAGVDGNSSEWSDFLDNIRDITSIPNLKYTIKWDKKMNQN